MIKETLELQSAEKIMGLTIRKIKVFFLEKIKKFWMQIMDNSWSSRCDSKRIKKLWKYSDDILWFAKSRHSNLAHIVSTRKPFFDGSDLRKNQRSPKKGYSVTCQWISAHFKHIKNDKPHLAAKNRTEKGDKQTKSWRSLVYIKKNTS